MSYRPHRVFSLFVIVSLLLIGFRSLDSSARQSAAPGTFRDVTDSLGIDVVPTGGAPDYGNGVAFCDIDGDNVLELYVAMGLNQRNRLYRDNGSGFEDVAFARGCADSLRGRGVAFADYDNDGDPDFFLANDRGPDRLYQNDGSGNFTDVAAQAGVDSIGKSYGVCWGDFDNDSFLDLFVCAYGIIADPHQNLLYHNNGDGTFREIAVEAGVADPSKPALCSAWIDYDNDDDLDLYICYDKTRGNAMYQNNGDSTFTDVADSSGTFLAFNAMGVGIADYDHNGFLDLYVSNTSEGNALLRNNGDGTFTDRASQTGTLNQRIAWGNSFLDYDNDGDEDLYVVNFAAIPNATAANRFYRHNGNNTFTDVAPQIGVADTLTGFALAIGDYNNDGFVDMFVNNRNGRSVFYENVAGSNNWLKIRTRGTTSNRDGIGAVVRVTTGPLTQVKDVRSGSSYLSQHSPELDFGMGNLSQADAVEITWPSGVVDLFSNVAVNQFLVANEGGSLHPVPVFITRFVARASAKDIELSWTVQADERIEGYRIYRRQGERTDDVLLNDGRLIDPAEERYVDTDVRPGERYRYALAVVKMGGDEVRSPMTSASLAAPSMNLDQNYPNPFNPVTTIRFSLPDPAEVHLDIYDARGRHVVALVGGARPAGEHEAVWNGRDKSGHPVGTGIYFYRLEAGRQLLTRKMLLLK